MKVQWEGVMPALTTAFTKEDSVDFPLMDKKIKAQLAAGVNGIILGGTLGEASTLTGEEMDRLVQHTVALVGERTAVIANIAEQATRAAIQAARRAQEQGAHGLMVLPPMRYKATDQEVVTYFKAIARECSLPIMIYNNPVDYKIEVTPDMFESLLEHKNIQAVKDSTRDISNIHRMKNRFGDRLHILCGVDTLALESVLMGAEGWVAGLVCAFPEETVAIFELARAGKIAEARTIYRWFLPLLELDLSPQLVQNIKLAEEATGLGSEFVRLPRLPLQGKERDRVLALLEDRLQTRPKLPDYRALQATHS